MTVSRMDKPDIILKIEVGWEAVKGWLQEEANLLGYVFVIASLSSLKGRGGAKKSKEGCCVVQQLLYRSKTALIAELIIILHQAAHYCRLQEC